MPDCRYLSGLRILGVYIVQAQVSFGKLGPTQASFRQRSALAQANVGQREIWRTDHFGTLSLDHRTHRLILILGMGIIG